MAETLNVDGIIEKLTSRNPSISMNDAQSLCNKIKHMFLLEPSLLEISGPLNIVGDIHGQINDLVQILKRVGLPPYAKWLFLGDYVDRGKYSVEVICLLFALKIKFPSQIYLIRGNHESRDMTEIFGFAEECRQKLNISMWSLFCTVFDTIPIGAVVNYTIFCVHGGISPGLSTLSQIAEITRPFDIPPTGMLTDLMWSDPSPDIVEYGDSTRGATVTWGIAPAKTFMKNNKLTMIVRGHQVALNGYEFPFAPNKSIVTVFSASNYDPNVSNKAGYIVIDNDGKLSYKTLTSNFAMTLPIPPRPTSAQAVSSLPQKKGRVPFPDNHHNDDLQLTPRRQMRPLFDKNERKKRTGSLTLKSSDIPSFAANFSKGVCSIPTPQLPRKRAFRSQSTLANTTKMARRNTMDIFA